MDPALTSALRRMGAYVVANVLIAIGFMAVTGAITAAQALPL